MLVHVNVRMCVHVSARSNLTVIKQKINENDKLHIVAVTIQ